MRPPRDTSVASLVAAALVAVIAGVHFEQYVDFMSEVPTVGVLFLLNAAGGAGLACALVSRDSQLRLLAAVGATGLAAGSLVSIAIALGGSFFGYSEPTLRLPIVIAILAEAVAIPVLISALVRARLDAAKPAVTRSR
jgi:hypothetical protein